MPSKLIVVVSALLFCYAAPSATAQCRSTNLKSVAELEKNSLVIDVRPDQINQFKGPASFKKEARIALVNLNPFLFSYSLKVDQSEIQDTGFLNFLKLLGSPVSDLIGSVSAFSRSSKLIASSGGNLTFLIKRTEGNPTLISNANCSDADQTTANEAATQISLLRAALLDNILLGNENLTEIEAKATRRKEANGTQITDDGTTLTEKIADLTARYAPARGGFERQKDVVFNSAVEAKVLCLSVNELHKELRGYPSVGDVKQLKKEVSDFNSLVSELRSSALDYKAEYENCPTRIKGLNYADNIVRLAEELGALGTAYEAQVSSMMQETKGYEALKQAIEKLETAVYDEEGKPVVENGVTKKENRLLQREYIVHSRYDISALDITATAVPLGQDSGLPNNNSTAQSGRENTERAQRRGNAIAQGNARLIDVGATETAEGVRVLAPHRARFQARSAQAEPEAEDDDGDASKTDKGGGAKEIKTTGTIGARRFEISAGMMFSSLDRKEFQTVQGYPRNEQGEIIDPATGNPTNDRDLTKIVGVSEQSSRRFAPLAMLHYRLPFSRNIFASVGFTGKRDDYGVDLEYLIGPSVLYKNMFLTFGGYAGKQQRLAGDLFEGSPIDGDIPVRKNYKWGFGFSFTYKIPLGDRDPGN